MGLWGGPYNPPSWFIALIISMYALFPMLAWFIKRSPHLTLIALLMISVLSRWYVGQYGLPLLPDSLLDQVEGWLYRLYGFMPGRPGDWFPPARVFEFGLGIWLALVVPASFWQKFNLSSGKAIAFFSDLSFPLFLIHYPFLCLVPWMTEMGIPAAIAIVGLILFLTLIAYRMNRLDSHVPRRKLMAWVHHRSCMKSSNSSSAS
jgi:peptidoglycan/LPS O-acetylase OafA/YrhL